MIMFVFLEMHVLIRTALPHIDLRLCGLPRTTPGGSRAGRYHFHAPDGEAGELALLGESALETRVWLQNGVHVH